MSLSWNEIRSRSLDFAREWDDVCSESAEAKSFWDGFFHVFGVVRRRVATFEHYVRAKGGDPGFIDLLWPGVLIAEHKSRGKNLDRAYTQAIDYFPGLTDEELPRYVIVSDFERFRVHDLDTGDDFDFLLQDFHQNIQKLGFIAGYEQRIFREQDPINTKAAEKLARLHDAMYESGYTGHRLEIFLVRVLFCLFAEDTGIFMPREAFCEYIEGCTREDGSDLGARLNELFDVLDTPEAQRLKSRDERLLAFPHVNGALFAETLRSPAFDGKMRQLLIDCCNLDWGQISPAIFGSLFQGIMDAELRRSLGAHYTSEKNILKVIGPLFLDDLRAELEQLKARRSNDRANKLQAFHDKLASLNFFDPACGCGNFLVITYREIRQLELEVIQALYSEEQQQLTLDVVDKYVRVDVNQFHGIEIEEWPAQIARVAMWLVDHQMNIKVSQTFGQALVRIPLVKSANIVHGNALQLDWNDVIPAGQCNYVFGNPPFVGKKEQSRQQKEEVRTIFRKHPKNSGIIDYVSCWLYKASEYSVPNLEIDIAFVTTKSITHGEQVQPVWEPLLARGLKIRFAHHAFKWESEAKGKAAVFVVVVGLTRKLGGACRLFTYSHGNSDPTELSVSEINPYLAPGSTVLIGNRSKPLCPSPRLIEGVTPLDNGLLSMHGEEMAEYLRLEPEGGKWIKRWVTGHGFINSKEHFCFWLSEISPQELRSLPNLMARVEKVRDFRASSKSSQAFASTPWLFRETAVPQTFVLVPKTSSYKRQYTPIGFLADCIPSSSCLYAEAGLYEFGVLTSLMSMSWLSYVGGRLKGDYRYSAKLVYNNFPWPVNVTEAQIQTIESAAQAVLDARACHPDATLADLYDPLSMPAGLIKAHQALDKAVDAAYGVRSAASRWKTEAERVGFLFELYEQYLEKLAPTLKS